MKLYLGVAKDIVVKRTIDRRDQKRVLGNLYDYDVVIKYEIENFKDQPVILDLAESMRALRSEIGVNNQRDVEWELVADSTLTDKLDEKKSTADQAVFHVSLPLRGKDDKAVKQTHTIHLRIKNEW
ncbi:MAG: DUF4139 domain-containing protein [Planctomycetes bacterium]|nr:DUF4139 domain-containing protein [Planctomycetota bacterium]